LASQGATDEQVLRFAVENGRVLVTLDADFANLMRFPPAQTLGVVRLKVHPATEERIRQAIRRALLYLQNIDITGRLAVVDKTKSASGTSETIRGPRRITPGKPACYR
jgi:predicted nuclease of predicted toxin-antitoxin system